VDIFVFGRRAGGGAAQLAKETMPGRLTLQHVQEYHRALAKAGIMNGKVSPLLLPDYVVQPKEQPATAGTA
jgi:succinate dehydrogenase/fumarate reductase flavoprotein subunit